jgi:'Cold-shock' DNA-binding domain
MHVVCNTLHVVKAHLGSAVHQVLLDCLLTLLQCLDLQTSIQTDGYRSLREAEEVEFDVESGDDGRTKAVNVTGPGGAPPLVRTSALP